MSGASRPWLRPVGAGDLASLRELLCEAAAWESGPGRPPAEVVLADPSISIYLDDWPREGDYGLVVEEATAPPIEAASWRQFTDDRLGYGFVSETIPELTIAVRAGEYGRGIGSSLLATLLDEARARDLPGLSLSVSEWNPARRLHARAGFACVERVGGSWTMVYGLG